jgi:hypothetical protein
MKFSPTHVRNRSHSPIKHIHKLKSVHHIKPVNHIKPVKSIQKRSFAPQYVRRSFDSD